MKVLIIEDEPFAQQELKRLLEAIDGEIDVVDMLDSIEDTVEWLKKNKSPELIFLDIQLADGLSFDIFKQTEVNSPVIFTTAYDQYAIKAFELNSIDYLLKPIEKTKLQKALHKFQRMINQLGKNVSHEITLSKKQLDSILELTRKDFKSRFITKSGNLIKHIHTSNIAYFFAEDNVVFLITRTGERYIIDNSIEEINNIIDPKSFFRLNRAFITHIDSIHKVHKYLNSRLKLELIPKCEKEVIISRKRVPDFLEWLEG